MNAEKILERIQQDARETASIILREAQRRADEMRAASDARIEQGRERTTKQAQSDARALEDRMERMAKLDARKEDLAAKRAVLDEAFQRALDKMYAMPQDQARALGMSMVLSAAAGDETVIPDEASVWCDQAFVDAANDALQKAGKQGCLTLSQERRMIGGGFVLQRGGLEVNCSFAAALDACRMQMEAEAAAQLFES